jgi:hypothetical protein
VQEHSARGSQESTDSSQPCTARETMDPPPTPNVTKKRKVRPNTSADPFIQIEKEKLKLFAGNAAVKEDSDYQFLMSLLPFLKNVPFDRKLTVRHKLQEVFIEEEQNALRPFTASPSPRSSCNESSYYTQPAISQFLNEEQNSSRCTPLSCLPNVSNFT